MTVLDNVAFHLEAMGIGRQERRRRGTELLSTLGLASFADLYPRALGGHEAAGGHSPRPARRSAGAPHGRALRRPRRPDAALSPAGLLRHWEERRKAVVFITHDVDEAVLLADRLLVLSGRPGKVMADFAVPLPRPRTPADTQRPEAAALKKQVWAMVEEQARYSLRALL